MVASAEDTNDSASREASMEKLLFDSMPPPSPPLSSPPSSTAPQTRMSDDLMNILNIDSSSPHHPPTRQLVSGPETRLDHDVLYIMYTALSIAQTSLPLCPPNSAMSSSMLRFYD
ncbi:unnamed protein product [Mortierella alpina]